MALLSMFVHEYPNLSRTICTDMAIKSVLKAYDDCMTELEHGGVLEDKIANEVRDGIVHTM